MKKMKSAFKLFLTLFVLLPVLVLSACQGNPNGDGDDDGGTDFEFKTWEYVQGFRAAVRPSNPGADAFKNDKGFLLFERFSESVLFYFIGAYGSGTDNLINYDGRNDFLLEPTDSQYHTDTQRNFLNFDSIRYSSKLDYLNLNGNEREAIIFNNNTHWNWGMHYREYTSPIAYATSASWEETYYYETYQNLTNLKNKIISHYFDKKIEYSNTYKFVYHIPLQINIFEVLLGVEPTKFIPTFYANNNYDEEVQAFEASETFMKMKVEGQTETIEIDPKEYNAEDANTAINNRLEYLKQEYARSTSYIGIQWDEDESFNGTQEPKSDGGRIVQFILSNIIGNERVVEDNYNILNHLSNENIPKKYYQDTITYAVKELTKSYEIIDEETKAIANANAPSNVTYNIGDTAGAFFPVAGIKYTDFRLNDFMVPEEGDDDFKNSKPYEYQSLLILPKKPMVFQSSILMFQSLTHDLSIHVQMRWYKKGTAEAVTRSAGVIEIKKGAYHWENNDNSLLVEPPYDVEATMNTSGIQQVLAINNAFGELDRRTNSKYYSTINSANGYGTVGVTNEKVVDFSFIEFVFDVVKSPTDPVGTNYSFQVVMMSFVVDELKA